MFIGAMLLLLISSFALICGLVAFCENVIRPQAAPPPETFARHGAAQHRKTLQVHIVRQSSV